MAEAATTNSQHSNGVRIPSLEALNIPGTTATTKRTQRTHS